MSCTSQILPVPSLRSSSSSRLEIHQEPDTSQQTPDGGGASQPVRCSIRGLHCPGNESSRPVILRYRTPEIAAATFAAALSLHAFHDVTVDVRGRVTQAVGHHLGVSTWTGSVRHRVSRAGSHADQWTGGFRGAIEAWAKATGRTTVEEG